MKNECLFFISCGYVRLDDRFVRRQTAQAALCGTGGIEKAGGLIVFDRTQQHALGDAGDEIADILGTD